MQQVQQLLSDATLQDYAAAFSPGTQNCMAGVFAKSHHQIFSMLTAQHDQSALKTRPGGERKDVEIEKPSPTNDAESGEKNSGEETTSAAPAKDLSSSVGASPVPEGARGLNLQSPLPQVLDEGFNSEQVRKSHRVCVKRL